MRTGSSDKSRSARHRAKYSARRISAGAMLIAAAFMISFAESALISFAPLPGFKPGLANLAVMAALCISPLDAVCVSLGRLIISAVFFGNYISAVMSFSGAAASLLILFAMHVLKIGHLSWIGVSYLSALFHNGGQLAAACLLLSSTAALSYAPVLLIFSAVCGILSGIIMNHISPIVLTVKDRYFFSSIDNI